jgi:excisionase family DNA binding protein
MAPRKRGKREPLTGPGVIERDGQEYLTVERAAEYLGKGRSTLFSYMQRFNLPTFKFPLQGKRVFLKRSDLDALIDAEPQPGTPKDDAA